ncbi:MAG: hypothetical protein R3D60_13280 [Paracoccaceae bacterium]
MQHEWMIRVIEDLRTYALWHGFTALASELDMLLALAHLELASKEARTQPPSRTDH